MFNINFAHIYDDSHYDRLNQIVKKAQDDMEAAKTEKIVEHLGLKTLDNLIDAICGGVSIVCLEPPSVDKVQSNIESTKFVFKETYYIKEDWGPDSVEEEING